MLSYFFFLDNTCMKFGGLVSTSNTYDGSSEVTVTTNEKITWSMGIEPFTKDQKIPNTLEKFSS